MNRDHIINYRTTILHRPLPPRKNIPASTNLSHRWSTAPSCVTNPSSTHPITTDGVKKATVDRSSASDRDSRTYNDPSCPPVNPLYPQVGTNSLNWSQSCHLFRGTKHCNSLMIVMFWLNVFFTSYYFQSGLYM
ncbi:hypothetical protein PILCRDRAFT_434436 [Piloderma croceum F 1598]|uniref:Uncharacterized protein n=1 Tax=Piloderma croceum (strain F 1598) TaxID=765440 RepID=A0A0C3BBS0_PILCF|nr:hypothetical protein PILCRDRAFT_434436 [Piloderma croceum F 1598]